MKKLLLAFVLTLTLSGCAGLQNAFNVVSGASVTDQQVYIARNAFDAVEVTATNYITFCKRNPRTYGCSREAIYRLIPAVRSGRVARNNLAQFQKDHPGQLGAKGLYDALVAATNTVQQIETQYQVQGVTK